MKHKSRSALSPLLSILVTFNVIAASVAPLLTPTPASAQTSPQDTDIFTGQFIPAYYGAAYDPTEAFKQMAGTPVYVFSYDTWGKVVNNFTYKTQIKADGSFQAAGLPNASHYGICLGVADDDSTAAFRAPLPEDGLQQSFAYSQAEFKPADVTKPMSINTQTNGQPFFIFPFKPAVTDATKITDDPKTFKGCRVYLTSSRSVDINNHINIFPVVPKSVLSIMINDTNNATNDAYQSNRPYEIYAKRIVVNNSNTSAGSNPTSALDNCNSLPPTSSERQNCINQANINIAKDNTTSDGPVIRGRTVPVRDASKNNLVVATMFQAYAPRGDYAITYWRPDDSHPDAQVTYLNFDGSMPLNTSQNGQAFETVQYPGGPFVITGADGKAVNTTNDWLYYSTRDPSKYSWSANGNGINLWGLVFTTAGGLGKPTPGVNVTADAANLYPVDVFNRKCLSTQSGMPAITDAYGVYFFTSNCDKTSNASTTVSTTITVPPFQASTQTYRSQDNVAVQATGIEGPTAKMISLSSEPTAGVNGHFLNKGIPLQFLNLDLKTKYGYFANIAQTDSHGYFVIPSGYFPANMSGQLTILTHQHFSGILGVQTQTLAYNLDTSNLHQPWLAMNSVGNIDVQNNISPVGSMLAQLSLPNLFSKLRIPEAYAATSTETPADFQPNDLQFWFNRSTVDPYKDEFTPANYTIDSLQIVGPGEAGLGNDYVVFDAYTDNTCMIAQCGLMTGSGPYVAASANASNNASTSASEIVGLRLKAKTVSNGQDITHPWWQMFQLSWNNGHADDHLQFNLSATFRKNDDAPKVDGDMTLPSSFQVSAPIVFIRNFDVTSTSQDVWDPAKGAKYQVAFDPNGQLQLEVTPPSCGQSDNKGWSFNFADDFKKVVGGVSNWFEAIPCRLVLGAIGGVKMAMSFMADHFFTLDPLSSQFSTVVLAFWNVIRNFVNGMAVFILVIAGMAIMFRYEPKTYSIQSVLTKLLISIVLVNFSILIIQAAVDAANVLALGGYHMLVGAVESGMTYLPISATGALGGVAGMAALMTYIFVMAAGTAGVGVIGILLAILGLLILFLYIILRAAFDWAVRLAVLMILIIVAPAAFAATMLPGTAKYFKKWRDMLVGTLIAQVAFALTLALALGLMEYAPRVGGGFTGGMLGMILALALFYYATKVPAKAAAAFGAGFTAGATGMLVKGALSARTKFGDIVAAQARRRNEAETDYFLNGASSWRDKRGRDMRRAITPGKWFTGKSAEDMAKARVEGRQHAQAEYKLEEESPEQGIPGLRNFTIPGTNIKLKYGNRRENALAAVNRNVGAKIEVQDAIDKEELGGLMGNNESRWNNAGRWRRSRGRFVERVKTGRKVTNARGLRVDEVVEMPILYADADNQAHTDALNETFEKEAFFKALRGSGEMGAQLEQAFRTSITGQLTQVHTDGSKGIVTSDDYEDIFTNVQKMIMDDDELNPLKADGKRTYQFTDDQRKALGFAKDDEGNWKLQNSNPEFMKNLVGNFGAHMRDIPAEQAENAVIDLVTRKYLNRKDPNGRDFEVFSKFALKADRGQELPAESFTTDEAGATGGGTMAGARTVGAATTPEVPAGMVQTGSGVVVPRPAPTPSTPTTPEAVERTTLRQQLQELYDQPASPDRDSRMADLRRRLDELGS